MHDDIPFVYAQNREEWRAWLQQNAHTAKEIGLVYYKKGTKMASISYEESVEEALCFGWVDGIRKGMDESRYYLRFTPRKPKSVWSQVNKDRVMALIEAGLMQESGLKMVEEAKQSGSWDEAYSMKGKTELPPDLEEALKKNPKAKAFLESLSPSNQFIYINQVKKLKGAELRTERIQLTILALEREMKPYNKKEFAIQQLKRELE